MKKNDKFNILYKKEVFYITTFLTGAVGFYIAKIIEDQSKVISGGMLGLVVPYLIYLAFVSPKNAFDYPLDMEDLKFPRDLRYFFYSFFWSMLLYWAGYRIIDLVRYLFANT